MATGADRLVGKWRILKTSTWDQAHLDLVGPAFIASPWKVFSAAR